MYTLANVFVTLRVVNNKYTLADARNNDLFKMHAQVSGMGARPCGGSGGGGGAYIRTKDQGTRTKD